MPARSRHRDRGPMYLLESEHDGRHLLGFPVT